MSWGVIFDFDGVIVNSVPCHEWAWHETAKELGREFSHEQFVQGIGVKNARFIPHILGWTEDPEEVMRISGRKEEIFQAYLRHHPIPLVNGLRPWLEVLSAHGIPCAIGSSSARVNIDRILEAEGLEGAFSAIISSECLQHGKPHPEVFLLAAQGLALPSSACVVFEDALLGIEAAYRSSCKAIALTTTFSEADFLALPHPPLKIIPDFSGLTFAKFCAWIA